MPGKQFRVGTNKTISLTIPGRGTIITVKPLCLSGVLLVVLSEGIETRHKCASLSADSRSVADDDPIPLLYQGAGEAESSHPDLPEGSLHPLPTQTLLMERQLLSALLMLLQVKIRHNRGPTTYLF